MSSYNQPQYETCSWEFCGNDAHYGYDCPPQVPFVYNQDPCFNQNFYNFPQTSPSFPQQFLCFDNCGGPRETFQCQLMNQNFYNSDSFGFDQFQSPQYFDVHQPPEEISIKELKTMMQSYCEIISQQREQEAILLQEQAAQKEQESLEQEQAVKEKQELLAEEQAANPFEPSLVLYFYNADSYNISTPSTTYTIHLTKSATIITNPSEPTRRIYHNHDIFYDGDEDEELFPDELKEFNKFLKGLRLMQSHPTFQLRTLLFDSLLEEFFGELAHIDLIPSGIIEADFDPEEEIHLVEKLFDSLMEEIDLFLTPDDSMPPGIETDDYDSEGDILFLEELLSNDSPESFHFDVPSSPRPPTKPPDDDDIEPDTGVFTKVVDDISDNSTRELYVHVPNVLPTLPTLSPMFDTLLPFSSENDDKVFNPGILASNEEKSPHLLSHRGFNPSKIISDFSESPMMISGGDIPILDVPIAPDFEASRARGFVLRSLELQSFA
ncbi:hypothetical protein Tco_0899809 [Tanacetum coccineum]